MSTDLMANLFKGYKMSSDQEFIKYIKTKGYNYEEGEYLSPYKLTHLADTKFKIMKGKLVWNSQAKKNKRSLHLKLPLKTE